MRFKDILRQFRARKNYTKAELAKRSGVSAVFVGNLENGTRVPNNEMCDKIAKALDLTIKEKDELIMASIEERIDEHDMVFIKRMRMDTVGTMNAEPIFKFCPQCGFKLK